MHRRGCQPDVFTCQGSRHTQTMYTERTIMATMAAYNLKCDHIHEYTKNLCTLISDIFVAMYQRGPANGSSLGTIHVTVQTYSSSEKRFTTDSYIIRQSSLMNLQQSHTTYTIQIIKSCIVFNTCNNPWPRKKQIMHRVSII